LEVTETGPNTGVFTCQYQVPKEKTSGKLEVSYGFLGFATKAELSIVNQLTNVK
jgi:hypothetical protein